jgi:pyruvate carboxylase
MALDPRRAFARGARGLSAPARHPPRIGENRRGSIGYLYTEPRVASSNAKQPIVSTHPIRKLLVANRGEIAIRVLRAAAELGVETVAIFSQEDRFALHRFKADESYLVGRGHPPVQAYLDVPDIVRIALDAHADAIHPGYGFLSENPEFADAVRSAGLRFIGPSSATMRRLGNKVSARELAVGAGVPVVPASGPLPADLEACRAIAEGIGLPLMVKASWGGGGRGMRVIKDAAAVAEQVELARREAATAFGNDELFFERYVERARHVEVQILGDAHGTVVELGERDCTVQRRHQKVIEEAPARHLEPAMHLALAEAALALAQSVGYENAGTVEFLIDLDQERFYFMEVNPRIQVEHTVTELVTGIDLVKAQIRIAEGEAIGTPASGVPRQGDIRVNGHALQCRITTEDPQNNFTPTYGQITAYRPATGFGVRLDGGTAYTGAIVTPFYDSLLEKVTVWAPEFEEARRRMLRALREVRVRGVTTNVAFLDALLSHHDFAAGEVTTRFIDESGSLLRMPHRRDRATRLLRFIGETIVNGIPEVQGRLGAPAGPEPAVPPHHNGAVQRGTRDRLLALGPQRFAKWMLDERRVLVTDTTFRDAHQSLLATRVRTRDIVRIAHAYAQTLPELFSLECWGGATFDVAMRFLKEDPWARLAEVRERVPNLLLQMLLRGANAVGYTSYPDNVVRHFVAQAADAGIDLFRIFDSLNWAENMRVAIDAVLESGKLCEAAMCYTGDILDPSRTKYDLKYYVRLAKELEATGAHILGIKDMAGLLKPEAARRLVRALKDEVGIPIHFHTHDTSGNSGASVLAAVESGVDAIDAAIDAMSGLTSQPNLGSIVAALRNTVRETGLDGEAIRELSTYWEAVRGFYRPFESGMRAGSSDVYEHEMPGGQYTNLREQAQSMGLGSRWSEITKTYAAVNRMFGDIVKVTPTSKVVGDLTLFMVASDLTEAQILDPAADISFPHSVLEYFHGDLGQPPGGFPDSLQRKVLKGATPLTGRPGASLPPRDFGAARAEAEQLVGRALSERELASYLMYPAVFVEFAKHQSHYGDVDNLETQVFFYGMQVAQETSVEIERGKTLVVRYAALGEPDETGHRTVYFELNGHPRTVPVLDRHAKAVRPTARKADPDDPLHVGSPMPGQIVKVSVTEGLDVRRGDPLFTIEAMKMQTLVVAPADGHVIAVLSPVGARVAAGDLLVELAQPAQAAVPA